MLELVRFAENFGLTFYDALYVHLAFQTKANLASLDEAMRNAATKLGLQLLPTAESK
jgi:predicted nucleic acid-binding protein